MPNVLVDTGIWFALFDTKDSHHREAREKETILGTLSIVIAWPVLYETLNTRFARNRQALRRFEEVLKRPRAVILDDRPYREEALELVFETSLRQSRPLSLTDCILRLVLDDPGTHIDYLATFNLPDFMDVCRRRRVELL